MTNIEALYKEALDPSTGRDRLKLIWSSTKSSRVRRAISSNPNLDAETMKMASRLYIKEVVNNTSVELIQLFTEDEFVKKLYTAYTDPLKFSINYRIRRLGEISNKGGDRVCIARAMLISPKLNSSTTVFDIAGVLSTQEFKRELNMDTEVYQRVKRIFEKETSYSLSQLLFLESVGISTKTETHEKLKAKPCINSYITKGALVDYITQRFKDVTRGEPDSYEFLTRFMWSMDRHHVGDILRAKSKSKYFLTDESLLLLADLYRDSVRREVAMNRMKVNNSTHRVSTSWSYELSKVIWDAIAIRANLGDKTPPCQYDLKEAYASIKLVGFDKDMGPNVTASGLFSQASLEKGGIKGVEDLCKALTTIDQDAFLFFLTAGCLSRLWYCKTGNGSYYSQVVERINQINQTAFGKNYGVLYKYSDVYLYHPVFRIEKVHPSAKIRYSSLKSDPLPKGSGKLSDDFFIEDILKTGAYPEAIVRLTFSKPRA